MKTFLRNAISKLYIAVLAPVEGTRDALTERLQGVRDTASLLYNRMMENMGYEQQERLKKIVEKEAEEKSNRQQPRKKRTNRKDQQLPKNNNNRMMMVMMIMMMMSDMIQLQK